MNEEVRKQAEKILRKTKSNMKKTDTYKSEFDASIERYANLRVQYSLLEERGDKSGCEIAEEYTKKAGPQIREKLPYI